jgi:hypothetical protein
MEFSSNYTTPQSKREEILNGYSYYYSKIISSEGYADIEKGLHYDGPGINYSVHY